MIVLWLLLAAVNIPCLVKSQGLPFYNESFHAYGEIFRYNVSLHDGKELEVFEEVYDSHGKKAALQIRKKDDILTFLVDMKVKKSYILRTKAGTKTTCADFTLPGSWSRPLLSDIIHAPDLRDYIALRSILILKSKLTVLTREEELTRGVYAQQLLCRSDDNVMTELKWTLNRQYVPKEYDDFGHKIPPSPLAIPIMSSNRDLPVSSYPWPLENFKDINSAMSTPMEKVPPILLEGTLRMPLPKSFMKAIISTRVYSIDYIKQPINHELLQIPDGVRCEGYRNPELQGPKYSSLRVFSFTAVFWTSKCKQHRRISGWLDVNQQLYRLDFSPPSNGSTSKHTTFIISGKEGVVYKIPRGAETPCEAVAIADIPFDPQMIIAPTEVSRLTAKTFFTGPDQGKTLLYKKPAFKHGIPCHNWDVLREDWPPGSSHVITLWEWCLVDMTKYSKEDKILKAVSLEIHVLEAPKTAAASIEDLAVGDTYFYHFFSFNETSAVLVERDGFFIGDCYPKTSWTTLRFTVGEKIIADGLSDTAFQVMVQKTVARFAGILMSSMRVGHIKADTSGENTHIETVLLDRFENSTYTQGSANITESIKKLQYHIKKKNISFKYRTTSYLVTEMCRLL